MFVLDDGYSRVMDSSSHAFGGDIENDDDGVENDENNGSSHEGEHDQKKGVLKGRGNSGSGSVSGSGRDNGSNGSSGGNGTRNGSSRGNPTFASEDDDDELCIADVACALDSDDDEIERDMKAMRGEDHGVGTSEGQVSSQQQQQQQQQQQPTNSSAATTITTTANSSSSSSSSSSNNSKNNNNNNNTTTESSNQFYLSFFSEEVEDDDVTHTNTGDLPSLLIL